MGVSLERAAGALAPSSSAVGGSAQDDWFNVDAHEWFLDMIREHEDSEVATDRVGPPLSLWLETIRRVVVE